MTNTLINPEDNIPIDMSKSQSKIHISWQVIFTILMFLFMYLPIFVLTFYSFNKSKYSAGWEGFTLQWYVKLFQDTRVLNALQNRLTVAICAV
ncbi:MAG: spermidine/putrescine ABC transporter permease PotC, partial [Okeania sp. SIO1H6]|nr:spermidine/putrescine ABC transporter permease PotC [Okeania sp. SIO1H6]